jgi:hypothetical protein
MSDLEAIQSVLVRAARRRRWERAWNGLWQGLFIGASVWLSGACHFTNLLPSSPRAERRRDFCHPLHPGRIRPAAGFASPPCAKRPLPG